MPGDHPFAGLPEHHQPSGGDYPWPGFAADATDLGPNPIRLHPNTYPDVMETLARIEQKLDETIKALKSGAIGAWGNQVSWRGQCHWEGCESRLITWTPPDGKNLCQIHSELLRETPGPHPIR